MLLYGGSPTLYVEGQNQKGPTCGPARYITPAARGVANASERGTRSKFAHMWAWWLHNQCSLGGPQHLKAGGKIRGGSQVGLVGT